MKIDHHHPQSIEELLLLTDVATRAAKSIIVQAGHFLLYYDDNKHLVRACIAEPTQPQCNEIIENFGHFPLLTWNLGINILKRSQCSMKGVILLVNDWQYLPKSVQRSEYYAQNPELPSGLKTCLMQHDDIQLLRPEIDTDEAVTGCYFGEMHLRNRYKKRIAKLIREKTLPQDVLVSENGEHLTCAMSLSGGQPTEIYCSGKSADCTAEVAELLLQLSKSRPQSAFINLYPIVCREFVEKGTILAARLGNLNLSTVINAGFPSTRVSTMEDLVEGCELSIYRFN